MWRNTVSTIRCAPQRCMFLTSEPKATLVESAWASTYAWVAVGV